MLMRPYSGTKYYCYLDTPIGRLGLAEDGTGISDLFFARADAMRGGSTDAPGAPDATLASSRANADAPDAQTAQDKRAHRKEQTILDYAQMQETPLLREAAKQIGEYFSGTRKAFDLPLSYHGTPFQMADWGALLTIPYGETRSYRDIAEQIGNPKAYRAVGMANNRNPIGIIIPCHRVIGHDGGMVGYGGGLPIKTYLLELERNHTQGGQAIFLRTN